METNPDSGQKLSFFAYFNGTNSVAMAVSTTFTRPTFDLVLKNEKDSFLHCQSLTDVNPDDLDKSFSSIESSSEDEEDYNVLLYEPESRFDDLQSSSDDSSSTSSNSSSASSQNGRTNHSAMSLVVDSRSSSSSDDSSGMSSSSDDSSCTSTGSEDDCHEQESDKTSMTSENTSETTLEQWKLRAFKDFQGTQHIVSNDQDKELLAHLKIEPVTTRQNSCEWHLGAFVDDYPFFL